MSEVTITIDNETGDMTFLDTPMAEGFKVLGTVTTKRASHVEPYEFWPRLAFSVIRTIVSDDSRIAEWTRGWEVTWRVNTRPIGGPILGYSQTCHMWEFPAVIMGDKNATAVWTDRPSAIRAEIEFLDNFFLSR
jgi:hypothetical protein